MKVFYAWQSDRDEASNRHLVRKALEMAMKPLAQDPEIQDAPELDHDTKGIPGSPHIAEAIAEKIKSCGIFVADLTFVAQTQPLANRPFKLIPNPNVLIELGLAASSIGWERIIMVMNTTFGSPTALPFDLRHRRFPIQFAAPGGGDFAEIKLDLANKLRMAIRAIISSKVIEHRQSVKVTCNPAATPSIDGEVRKALLVTVTNTGEGPVVITGFGLLRSDNCRMIFGLRAMLRGWPVPKRLEEAEQLIIPIDATSFQVFAPELKAKSLTITHAYATDSYDNMYTTPFSDDLLKEMLRT